MRIMTLNIWGDYFGNPVDIRMNGIYKTVIKYNPDILGFQEVTRSWYDSRLFEKLDGYKVITFPDDYVPLLYKANKYDVIDSGYEKYKETPDISKGITWAVFEDKKTKQRIGAACTHWWWKNGDEHELIRVLNAKQLLKRMNKIKEEYSVNVVAFGDLNACDDTLSLNYLEENNVYSAFKLTDNFSNVSSWHNDPQKQEDGTYHGTKTTDDEHKSIDHIILEKGGLKILKHNVAEDQFVLDSTDHSPVYIDVSE